MRLHEGDPTRRYAMPDPDDLRESYDSVRQAVHPGSYAWPLPDRVTVDRAELARVLTLAQGYLVLTTDGGQEQMVGKLRDVWRARRARAEGAGGE